MNSRPSLHEDASVRDDALVSDRVVCIRAADGYGIKGTFFTGGDDKHHDLAVVLSSGAGVPARYYRRFARYLASLGMAVLTYDYRGIGESRPRSLRGFTASIEDWATFDSTAAIMWLAEHSPARTLIGMSHSIGALILGGAGNVSRLRGLVMIAPHTAYFGDYLPRYRLPMAIAWHGLMPALTLGLGYFPGKLVRLGEDIPKGVAMQWARRIRPGVRLGDDAGRTRQLMHAFRSVHLDAATITARDDAFATLAGVARAKSYFPNMAFTDYVIELDSVGQRRVGHFGYFRKTSSETVWPFIVRTIAKLVDGGKAPVGETHNQAGATAR